MRSLALMANDYQFWMGGILATQLEEITDDPKKVDQGGFWAALISFEGARTFARFNKVEKREFPHSQWEPIGTAWHSSINRKSYIDYVSRIREAISLGGVYQVNACRELSNTLKDGSLTLDGLFSKLLHENPAPYASYFNIQGIGRFFDKTKDGILVSNSAGGLSVITTVTSGVLGAATALKDTNTQNVVLDTDFYIAGIGDYNGNGYDDIIWRKTNANNFGIFSLANSVVSRVSLPGFDPSLVIQAKR